MIGTGGGGRGGLGIRGGAGAPLPFPLACFDLSVAWEMAGLRIAVEACVEIDWAGEERRVVDSGDDDRRS